MDESFHEMGDERFRVIDLDVVQVQRVSEWRKYDEVDVDRV